jgi:ParB family chromosome partitioning protein
MAMVAKKRGLGRGLDALLGSSVGAGEGTDETPAGGELRDLPLDLVQRGRYQPRTDMDPDALEGLAASIRAQGVVQPIVVRPLQGGGRYEIIAGERRWRAAQLAGLHDIPAVVRDVPDQAAMAIALIENIQRENLNPMEEAQALKRLIDEFEMTHQQTADAVGRSRAAVSNLLRLLDLNGDVKRMVENGDLEMGHARALLGLSAEAQSQAARQVVAKGLSVRETEQLVRRLQAPVTDKPATPALDPDIRKLQEDLSAQLGAMVRIQHSARGKGRLVVLYNSIDELDGILAHLK